VKVFNKLGFTFVELIVSITISVIILWGVFYFLANMINDLSFSNKKSNILSSFYTLWTKVNNYRNIFLSGWLAIDSSFLTWSDVVILKNNDNSYGVLFWVVNKDIMKIETPLDYLKYNDKTLGFRELTAEDLSGITSDVNTIYGLSFQGDKLFDFPLKSFQADFYKSWTIMNVDFSFLVNYKLWFKNMVRIDVPNDSYDLFNVSFNF